MKRDGRKLSSEQQLLQRQNAVNMFFQEGYTKVDIALALGASRQNVSRWCNLYEEGGLEAWRPWSWGVAGADLWSRPSCRGINAET